MQWLSSNVWWLGPVVHVIVTFVVADIIGTILYKKSRKTAWANIALQVHPALCFASAILFVFLWIPCR